MARILGTLLAAALVAGCTTIDPWGHRRNLEEAQLSYTQMVRWGDFERASRFVEADGRERFLDDAEAFAGVRITEYDIGPVEVNDDGETATVSVSYRAYHTTTLVERELRETQDWFYVDGSWRVRPELAGLGREATQP